MRIVGVALLALIGVAIVGFVVYGVVATTHAVNVCRNRGFATGDAYIDGSIVCYRGELIRPGR